MINNVKLLKIKQEFEKTHLEDVSAEVHNEFYRIGLDKKINPGMKIAITAGSRGIDRLGQILKSIIYEIKKYGGEPFIVAAMGSHGGATAEGQLKVLEHYGITEEALGIPVKSSMETIELDYLENGLPVYFDKIAYHADGVIAVNRVKAHTAFKGNIESGLCKMLSAGLGNHLGAKLIHSLGVKGLRDYMVDFARVIIKKAPIMGGFGILENAYDKVVKIKAALPEDFFKVDSELLIECKNLLPKLPVNEIDILIVQEMGKNISGTGLDTNVVGGIKSPGDFKEPSIKRLLVLDLTEETEGNALGIGLADMITQKVYKKINFNSTYTNTITATFLDRARIPMVFPTEYEAVEVGLKTIWNLPSEPPRIIIIKNTLKLDEMYVSEAIWEEIRGRKNIVSSDQWEDMQFNKSGEILNRIS